MHPHYDDQGFKREESYKEICKKCNGRGRFVAWSGRTLGECFACKGVGHKDFKTDAPTRAAARSKATARKMASIESNRTSFAASHPTEWAWMTEKAPKFGFAASMVEAVEKFGELTEGQMGAVQKLMARDAERQAVWNADREAKAALAETVDTTGLMEAFDRARTAGLKRPKMRFEGFTASLAPATGANAGAIYLKNGETYLGKIADGKFLSSRDCSVEEATKIAETMRDPLTAAVIYGRKFGVCSCCGRELTDGDSIKAGIGPICAEKFGL